MAEDSYLPWVIRHTPTCWWHDSAHPRELDFALEHGCVGATTNPFLSNLALAANRQLWSAQIAEAMTVADAESRAEALMRIPVTSAAAKLRPLFDRTEGRQGWVCAQVNPSRAGDRPRMLAMARRFAAWAPNITVKLPATAAGLDVMEDCIAEGITATMTVSFTVPQVIAVGERHRAGQARARRAGVRPGGCFAVLMVGRLDDYLREIAEDVRADVRPSDINLAGIAVAKRALSIIRERGYEVGLIIAALRGTHHMTELAGGELIMSIFPSWQKPLLSLELPREAGIDRPVGPEAIDRLSQLPDFVVAYEPNGMHPSDFISYGLTQRTLAQFVESGWKLMETFKA